MTPSDLDAYLAVIQHRGALSAHVSLAQDVSFTVNFAPEMPAMPEAREPEPGGWKSPIRLDNPQDIEPMHLAADGELPT